MPSEMENATLVRRSWHAGVDLPEGAEVREEHLRLLRPEGGVSPAVDIRGRVLVRAVAVGEPIKEEDLAPLGQHS